MSAHTEGKLKAGRAYFGGSSAQYTPKITAGDSARVLCFLNLSGAYNGYAGLPQADADARRLAACWNACEGMDTGEVEGLSVSKVLADLMNAQRERDELRERREVPPGSMTAATVTSAELRNTAQFGTPLRADTVRQLADQQDALLDALAQHYDEDDGAISMQLRILTAELLGKHGRPA